MLRLKKLAAAATVFMAAAVFMATPAPTAGHPHPAAMVDSTEYCHLQETAKPNTRLIASSSFRGPAPPTTTYSSVDFTFRIAPIGDFSIDLWRWAELSSGSQDANVRRFSFVPPLDVYFLNERGGLLNSKEQRHTPSGIVGKAEGAAISDRLTHTIYLPDVREPETAGESYQVAPGAYFVHYAADDPELRRPMRILRCAGVASMNSTGGAIR